MAVATQGRWIDLKKARIPHWCDACPDIILPDEPYFQITHYNSGLSGKIYPDRVHKRCFQKYLDQN